ncbi:unannotated protein [freshwater metagenome]|uniref:Unannotated protein n=1 Tax=freshwater metagenome TaxID=449393 RepID=A0A6J7UR68_9ZZZZ
MYQFCFCFVSVCRANVVVEVFATSTHSADVQSTVWAHHVENFSFGVANVVFANSKNAARTDVEWLQVFTALCSTGLQLLAPYFVELFRNEHDGQPTVGQLCSCLNAEAFQACPPNRNVGTQWVVDELEWFTESSSFARWQRCSDGLTLIVESLFTLPHFTAYFDVFLNALHWLLVRNAVETFHHLWARCTETKNEATIAHVIATSAGHCHECCRTRVHVHNACSNFHAISNCGKVTHLRNSIETVRLGDPYLVESCFFQLYNSRRGFFKATGIVDHH